MTIYSFFRPCLIVVLLIFSIGSNAEFRTFEDYETGKDYYENVIEPFVSKLRSRPFKRLLKVSKEQESKNNNEVGLILSTIKKLYPNIKVPDENPLILIRDFVEKNAEIPSLDKNGDQPYLVIINSSLLLSQKEVRLAIMAHELAHLLLQPKDSFVFKYYQQTPETPLAYSNSIINDPNIEKLIKLREELRLYAGPFSIPELNGVPFHYTEAEASSQKELLFLLDTTDDSPECLGPRYYYSLFRANLLKSYVSASSFKLKEELLDKDQLNKVTRNLIASLKGCLQNKKVNYRKLNSDLFHLEQSHIDSLLNNMSPFERGIFERVEEYYSQHSAVDAIINYTQDFRDEIRAIEEQLDIKTIRIYNLEDHADEISVEVLHYLGISPKPFIEDFLLQETSLNECNYTEGFEPSYGPLEMKHHLPCWRAYRFKKYTEYLSIKKQNSDLIR